MKSHLYLLIIHRCQASSSNENINCLERDSAQYVPTCLTAGTVAVVVSVAESSPTPWTVDHQAPLSVGFTRQESWSGLPFLLQGIFSTQGQNLGFPHCSQILYHLSHREASMDWHSNILQTEFRRVKGTSRLLISVFVSQE